MKKNNIFSSLLSSTTMNYTIKPTWSNSTTRIVAEYVLPYIQTDGWSKEDYVSDVIHRGARIISCEEEYVSKNGELFPSWASIVSCPRTNPLINWTEIDHEIDRYIDLKDKHNIEIGKLIGTFMIYLFLIWKTLHL